LSYNYVSRLALLPSFPRVAESVLKRGPKEPRPLLPCAVCGDGRTVIQALLRWYFSSRENDLQCHTIHILLLLLLLAFWEAAFSGHIAG
jgi:hypothetical protein